MGDGGIDDSDFRSTGLLTGGWIYENLYRVVIFDEWGTYAALNGVHR